MPLYFGKKVGFAFWGCFVFWTILASLYSFWAWTSELNDFGGDSAMYLLAAQHWSIYGLDNPVAAHFTAKSIFPPFYPLLLALFPAGDTWLIAHQITMFCGIAALFFYWRWLRLSGLPLPESLVAVALLGGLPGFYMQALYLQSEFLFMFFVAACLYTVSLLERESKISYVVVAALAAASAYLTRGIGISLIVALIVYFFLNRPKKEWPIVVVIALTLLLAWRYFGQHTSAFYVSSWSARLGVVEWGGLSGFIAAQSVAMMDGFAQNLIGQASIKSPAVYLFSLACSVSWLIRLWQRKLDALFLGAYFAILLFWPYPEERVRYLLPAVPILFAQLFLVIHGTTSRHPSWNARIALRFCFLILAVAILPSLAVAMQRRFESMPAELAGLRQSPEWHGPGSREERLSNVARHKARRESFADLKLHVPADDCVYAIKPALVGIFAQRISVDTPLPDSSLGMVLDSKMAKCRYVYMETFNSPSYAEHFYPFSRWQTGLEVLQVNRVVDSLGHSSTSGLVARIK